MSKICGCCKEHKTSDLICLKCYKKKMIQEFKEDFNPILILLKRVYNNEYFFEDDIELGWRKNYEKLEKCLGDKNEKRHY